VRDTNWGGGVPSGTANAYDPDELLYGVGRAADVALGGLRV
jgi:hypothetical protein